MQQDKVREFSVVRPKNHAIGFSIIKMLLKPKDFYFYRVLLIIVEDGNFV